MKRRMDIQTAHIKTYISLTAGFRRTERLYSPCTARLLKGELQCRKIKRYLHQILVRELSLYSVSAEGGPVTELLP